MEQVIDEMIDLELETPHAWNPYVPGKPWAPRCYVAGSFQNQEAVKVVQAYLRSLGIEITYDWTQTECASSCENDARGLTFFARQYHQNSSVLDIDGVNRAHFIVAVFTDQEYLYRGTFTEIGVAIGQNKPIIAFVSGKPHNNDDYFKEIISYGLSITIDKERIVKSSENSFEEMFSSSFFSLTGYASNVFFWSEKITRVYNKVNLEHQIKNLFPSVILFCGYAGCGKDTASKIIREICDLYDTKAFADKVRQFACAQNPLVNMVGSPGYQNSGASPGNQSSGACLPYNTVLEMYGGYEIAKRLVPNIRNTLVAIGHGARISIGEDIWINQVFFETETKNFRPFCITDGRYNNEGLRTKKAGGVVVMIEKVGCLAANETEAQSVSEIDYDYLVTNNGSLDVFKSNLLKVLRK